MASLYYITSGASHLVCFYCLGSRLSIQLNSAPFRKLYKNNAPLMCSHSSSLGKQKKKVPSLLLLHLFIKLLPLPLLATYYTTSPRLLLGTTTATFRQPYIITSTTTTATSYTDQGENTSTTRLLCYGFTPLTEHYFHYLLLLNIVTPSSLLPRYHYCYFYTVINYLALPLLTRLLHHHHYWLPGHYCYFVHRHSLDFHYLTH